MGEVRLIREKICDNGLFYEHCKLQYNEITKAPFVITVLNYCAPSNRLTQK